MSCDAVKLAEVRALATSGAARRIRQRANLSLAEVAAACGVDQSTVHRWECGKRSPRGPAALRYAALLDALGRAATPVHGTAS